MDFEERLEAVEEAVLRIEQQISEFLEKQKPPALDRQSTRISRGRPCSLAESVSMTQKQSKIQEKLKSAIRESFFSGFGESKSRTPMAKTQQRPSTSLGRRDTGPDPKSYQEHFLMQRSLRNQLRRSSTKMDRYNVVVPRAVS